MGQRDRNGLRCDPAAQPVDLLERLGATGRSVPDGGAFGKETVPKESDQKRNRR